MLFSRWNNEVIPETEYSHQIAVCGDKTNQKLSSGLHNSSFVRICSKKNINVIIFGAYADKLQVM